MSIHSLRLADFQNDNYTLIAIYTVLKDYRLAYLLNESLEVDFSRVRKGLAFENNTVYFALYECFSKKTDSLWYFISNVSKEDKPVETGIFTTSTSCRYLITEQKKVDFFLKLEGDLASSFVEENIEKINRIPQVITAYTVDAKTLKSKEFLMI